MDVISDFSSCHWNIFSEEGQVSSIIITFLVDIKKSFISGRRVETVKNTGTTYILFKPNLKFQSEVECSMSRKSSLREVLVFFVFPDKVGEIDVRRYICLYMMKENALVLLLIHKGLYHI